MSITEQIENILREALNPAALEIVNQSHLHAGHSGDDGSGESHFRLRIVSDKFEGCSRLERHRIVNELIDSNIDRPHALSVKALTPEEYDRKK